MIKNLGFDQLKAFIAAGGAIEKGDTLKQLKGHEFITAVNTLMTKDPDLARQRKSVLLSEIATVFKDETQCVQSAKAMS